MADPITDQRIETVRPMTDGELAQEGWMNYSPFRSRPTVLVLANGMKIYPSVDPEGNGPGALFGTDPDGQPVKITPEEE